MKLTWIPWSFFSIIIIPIPSIQVSGGDLRATQKFKLREKEGEENLGELQFKISTRI